MTPEQARGRLAGELDDLARLSEGTAAGRRPVALDQQSVGRLSRMDALQDQAMALATEERRRLRRRQIEAALRRIEAGEFGFCAVCGEDIPPRRLALDPAIATCVGCAGRK